MTPLIHIKVRPYRSGGWEADCTLNFEDDLPPLRIRKVSPFGDEKKTNDWAERMCMRKYKEGRPKKPQATIPVQPPILTLEAFGELFLSHQGAGNTKATQRQRDWALRLHILPFLGHSPLDEIGTFEQLGLQKRLLDQKLGARTINLVLWTLHFVLKTAVSWKRLTGFPTRLKRLAEPTDEVEIYGPDEYERLVTTASAHLWTRLFVLLGGDAGLRVGELLGLMWRDVSLPKGELVVRQQETESKELTPPKGKKSRKVPLTSRLKEALQAASHLGDRVLVGPEGTTPSRSTLARWLAGVERRAQVIGAKSPHKLRHTFASRLLASGAHLKQVQVLLGHARLETTHMYLHLLPGAGGEAIRGLDRWTGELAEKK